ncbi:recombinase family protein [Rhizobium sp. FKL33]|uniref:recombinase family protein n=1 Tax=Rhizobium sp. FKL33 TaxID=2562307 RepID=UPI0010C0C490|nr:recombinase family protein [Rhizobium sp. FKL33]
MSEKRTFRCAIYTRKSSDEGLDQAFNSLDAQREACSAYIASQESLGWRLVPELYDDGGISGGTLERPAIQRLLRDIRNGAIDIIVVYKIDRLTRSLTDFAKLVDVFDKHGTSFVSVTQQFNTTTSMGRLTLNVLLSFAQFEREVTAERIRDKIAASKKKGMWMGGTVPFGYKVNDRKLVIDEGEAKQVRRVFDRYLELQSAKKLLAELNGLQASAEAGICVGASKQARRYSYSNLLSMLANPIYAGKVRHKNLVYDGEHSAIIAPETFAAVQRAMADNAVVAKGARLNPDIHLLTGKIFDHEGHRLTPVHATNHGKRYRYYATDMRRAGSEKATKMRIAAAVIEPVVIAQMIQMLRDGPKLSQWIADFGDQSEVQTLLEQAHILSLRLEADRSGVQRRLIFRTIMDRVIIGAAEIRYVLNIAILLRILANQWDFNVEQDFIRRLSSCFPDDLHDEDHGLKLIEIVQPCVIKRRGVEMRLIVENAAAMRPEYDETLIAAIAKAHIAVTMLTERKGRSISQVATNLRMNGSDLCRVLPLAFLSPKVTQAILSGRQPPELTLRKLTRSVEIPIAWVDQDELM